MPLSFRHEKDRREPEGLKNICNGRDSCNCFDLQNDNYEISEEPSLRRSTTTYASLHFGGDELDEDNGN